MLAFLYHELYNGRGFSPIRDSWKRYRGILDLIELPELRERIVAVTAPLATEDELHLVHPPRYLAWIREQEAAGDRLFDRSTPAWSGVVDRARAAVGASILGARLIGSGAGRVAVNPSGGLHHAHPERASGFCILNDVAIAVRVLQREFGLSRIAVVDVDGHHGDGTQAILYEEPVLFVSLHRYGGRFYPGTGGEDERGAHRGSGHTINVPLPRNCGDAAYLRAMHEIVEPALHRYGPQCIILQYGVDGHFADSMVRLGLTTHAYAHIARLMRDLADRLCGGRLLVVGGGGYRPQDAVRCWAFLLGELADAPPRTLAHLHDGPPFPEPEAEAGAHVTGVRDRWRAAPKPSGTGAARSGPPAATSQG